MNSGEDTPNGSIVSAPAFIPLKKKKVQLPESLFEQSEDSNTDNNGSLLMMTTPRPTIQKDLPKLKPLAPLVLLTPDDAARASGGSRGPTPLPSPLPSPCPEKVKQRRIQWKLHASNDLIRVLSALYGKLLVVMGMSFPLAEVISARVPDFFYEGFYLYLYLVSIVFLLYVYVFILKRGKMPRPRMPNFIRKIMFWRKVDGSSKDRSRTISVETTGYESEASQISFAIKKKKYEDNAGNGSFYLRLGAVAFGIGSMIYSVLEFSQLFELDHSNKCFSYLTIITPFFRCIFTFIQMYFIFLNSKMLIYKSQRLARFGLMHIVATNLCVWLNVLIEESKHGMGHAMGGHGGSHGDDHHATNGHGGHLLDNQTMDGHGNNESVFEIHERHRRSTGEGYRCLRTSILGQLVQDASPFLFPCCIEYSLICAAVVYVMWKNIGKKEHKHHKSTETIHSRHSRHQYSMDCSGANKGLFLGILILTLTFISLILFFVLINNDTYHKIAITEAHASGLVLYVITVIAVIVGFIQMRKLDYDKKRNMELDSILLVIAQTGLYVYSLFNIIGGHFMLSPENYLMFITGLGMLFQGTLQTIFIIDASRRVSIHSWQIKKKPGRECVTLLLVSNLAMWAINTFETSRSNAHPVQLDFYGHWAWTIIIHTSMPLCIFYRFHSTVCLCDVWTRAYKMKSMPA